jgi:heme A synthase
MMSGLTLIGSLVLFVWAFRSYQRGDPVRVGASLVLGFTVTEALLGAGLVLFQLVAQNASVARAVSVAAHLVNTLLLLAAITLTAWWASGNKKTPLRWQGSRGVLLVVALLGAMLLSASGAVTALGDTLFPSGSISAGIQQDFLPTANFLVRLRIYHPLIAMSLGIYLTAAVLWVGYRQGGSLRRLTTLLISLFGMQLILGLLNVTLLAPVWLQLVHLLVADLVWISLVILSLAVFSQAPEPKGIDVKAVITTDFRR